MLYPSTCLYGLTWIILLKVSWLLPNLEVCRERVSLVDLASLSIMLLRVLMEMATISKWCLVHLWGAKYHHPFDTLSWWPYCFWTRFMQSTWCGYEARLCLCCMSFFPVLLLSLYIYTLINIYFYLSVLDTLYKHNHSFREYGGSYMFSCDMKGFSTSVLRILCLFP